MAESCCICKYCFGDKDGRYRFRGQVYCEDCFRLYKADEVKAIIDLREKRKRGEK